MNRLNISKKIDCNNCWRPYESSWYCGFHLSWKLRHRKDKCLFIIQLIAIMKPEQDS